MKAVLSGSKMMTNGQDGGITFETDPASSNGNLSSITGGGERRHSLGFFHSRMHNRSASWSFTGATTSVDLSSSLASINPIRSVIREFVPSLNTTQENTISPPSRTTSQLSFGLLSPTEESPPRNSTNLGLSHTAQAPPNTMTRDDSRLSLGSDNTREQPFADVGIVPDDVANGANGNVEISDWVRWVEQNAIFFMLLTIRYAWMHRSGLLVLIGMFATYLHCNQTIKKQVALKNRRQKKFLLLVILFLCGNIYFVYYVFREEKLHNCLVFMTPMLFLDLWNLFWCICVTDFIIRFATMVLKALIAICFLRILPSRKKGKYYMLLEYISQFYRTLVPTPLWFGFCSNYYDTGAVFAIIITASYLMIKGAVILSRGRELIRAICSFIKDKTYGVPLKRDDLLELCEENACPICQDEFSGPIMLRCRHVFCENCVLQWFDRERTCPLCRASIANDPKWRDGSTTAWPQLF